MLGVMRKYAYSWTIRILLGVITAVFIFWGVGAGFFSQVHPVATVDHERILPDQLDQEATRLRERMQQLYGARAVSMLKGINLREQALEMIIERMLIDHEARRIGLQISNRALKDNIASQTAFQVNGHFDFRTYEAVLRNNNLLPSAYEQSQRAAMLAGELQKMVIRGVQVSDDEAHHLFNFENQLVVLSYFEIPYASFTAAIHPTAQQVADYYKQHGDDFRQPERIRITYIPYNPMTLAADTKPTEQEIKEYYERHLKTVFTHPEQVDASHILIAVAPDAGPKAVAAARKKAEDILKQLKAGANFAKLARRYSDDPGTKDKGGDLGFFTRDQMVKPFADAAFSLKPGQLTIARSRFGYHVIRLDGIKPAHVDSLKAARAAIVSAIKHKVGVEQARQDLDRDLSAALAGTSLDKLAAKRGLKAVTTPFFASGDQLPGIGDDSHLEKQAFKMQKGDIRAVLGGKTPCLVKFIDRHPSHIPPLKEIEPRVRAALIRATAEAKARALGRKLLGQIKDVSDFNRVAAANKFQVYTTPAFPRSSGSVPGIGDFFEVANAAALAPKLPSVINRVMVNDGNAYLFTVMQRTPPDQQEWLQAASKFKKRLLQARQQQAWAAFVQGLKDQAEITVDPNQLGGPPAPAPAPM